MREYGFDLHKGAFRDAVSLRYGWRPPELPSSCVCGNAFTIDPSLSCPYGGFTALHHIDVHDLTASLLKDVCPNVCKEPPLQSLTGETLQHKTASIDSGARLDVCDEGLWDINRRELFLMSVCSTFFLPLIKISLL